MNDMQSEKHISPQAKPSLWVRLKQNWLSIHIFKRLIRAISVVAVLMVIYWLFIASDRYVSEATVILRKTDSAASAATDLSAVTKGMLGINRADQFLLREYLLSVDMLKKLDQKLNLREHFSDSSHDLFSRMWFGEDSIEHFHKYYLSRVSVEYDDYAGVLRIAVQAYDAKFAQDLARALVQEGERYMNQLGHELAQAQVDFLVGQVDVARQRVQETNQALLRFQNNKGLISPQATAEGINAIVGKLEEQRSQIQTNLAALPKNLNADHPNVVMLQNSLAAVDRQISRERAKLATPDGKPLNYTMEEHQRLQMETMFAQDIYKAALSGLERGRSEATRMIDKVSVLQAPSMPEYPLEPRRLYNAFFTLLVAFMLAGILKLLESIVRDHVD